MFVIFSVFILNSFYYVYLNIFSSDAVVKDTVLCISFFS